MRSSRTDTEVRLDEGCVLEIAEFRGPEPGPTAALIAGVHGDEDEGVVTLQRVAAYLEEHAIKGVVKVLPISNPPAFNAITRESPVDGLNLARVFPGRPDGALTERIAHAITTRLIHGSDLLIDLHSAGRALAVPFWCGYHEEDGSVAAETAARYARAFGAPLIWAHLIKTHGRSLSAAIDLGIPALYAEAGGGGEVRGEDADMYFNGILNVLAASGILPPRPAPGIAPRMIRDRSGDTDEALAAPCNGMLVTRANAGAQVTKGQVLAEIFSADGRVKATIAANADGILVITRRYARVKAGDPVAMIADTPRQLEPYRDELRAD
jgi:predicted deacylase